MLRSVFLNSVTHSHASGERRCRGATLIWTVMTIGLMISVVGLTIDTAWCYYAAHQLQNCADASALAGVHEIRNTVSAARDQATAIGLANTSTNVSITLERNDANAAGGDVVVGQFDRSDGTFTPQLDPINAVQVNARRTAASPNGAVPLFFGSLAGVTEVSVQRDAIAMLIGGVGAGVIALNPTVSCSFDVRGTTGEIIVNDGAIYVNSTHPDAACHSGQPTVSADELHLEGGTDRNFDDQVNFDGTLVEESPLAPIPDPLAGLPDPPYDPANDLGTVLVNGGAAVEVNIPGYYSGGFRVENGTLTVGRGVYILDGEGLDVNGGNLLAQDGVLFYIVGSGNVDIRGNGEIRIDAATVADPTVSGDPLFPYVGVPIFQARDNTNDSRILGTANFSITGTLYFPAAELEIGGTSDNFANGLIADTIFAHGDGELNINYEGQFGVQPRIVFLVE